MKQYQVVVFKDFMGNFWYTAQQRTIRFLYRSPWRDITPIGQDSYEKAEALYFDECNCKLSQDDWEEVRKGMTGEQLLDHPKYPNTGVEVRVSDKDVPPIYRYKD